MPVKYERKMDRSKTPEVTGFFDKRTFSVQYVVADPATKQCAIIDPVLDFDEKSGATATHQCRLRSSTTCATKGLSRRVDSRHASSCRPSLGRAVPEGKRPARRRRSARRWSRCRSSGRSIYNWPDFPADGSQWDKLFAEGETFKVGRYPARGAVLARAYAGLDHLCDRRRGLRSRHAVHAGQRHGAGRFSRRQRQRACGSRSRKSWRCPTRPASSPATTTSRTAASRCGRSTVAEQKATNTHMSKCKTEARFRGCCAKRATRPCRCPS